jgi:hypothetical protein
MKELRTTFTDAEFRRLKKAKLLTNYPWHTFILIKCCKGISEKRTYKS